MLKVDDILHSQLLRTDTTSSLSLHAELTLCTEHHEEVVHIPFMPSKFNLVYTMYTRKLAWTHTGDTCVIFIISHGRRHHRMKLSDPYVNKVRSN